MKFIDDAWNEFKHLWVIRVLLATTVVNALLGGIYVLAGNVSPFTFIAVNVILNVLAMLLRMLKQTNGGETDGNSTAGNS